jgi:hypothetical protein
MKNKNIPNWVIFEIQDLVDQNIDVHDWEAVKFFLRSEYRFTMLEWILSNRDKYYYCILSRQFVNAKP